MQGKRGSQERKKDTHKSEHDVFTYVHYVKTIDVSEMTDELTHLSYPSASNNVILIHLFKFVDAKDYNERFLDIKPHW